LVKKAILFDLGRVIVPIDFGRLHLRIEAMGGLASAEVQAQIVQRGLLEKFETGNIKPGDFADQLSAACGISVSKAEFCELWCSIFLPGTLVRSELLEELAGRYRLILLSNTNVLHFEMIRANYPLLRHFHAYVLSYKVGAMKPSPEIYRKAVEAAGCLPEECFFTDDMPDYVEGARKYGIDAVQFTSERQLMVDLEKRGII
jgi:FMN phosphatase YigB (HAD superfamily)